MFPDSSLTTSFSSLLCFFIRADVLWKLPRLTALWKTWGNFRASSPSVPQVFHRAFEIASRFQRAAWKTLRVSHSSHRTLLLDIYRPQDARNHNLPRRVASGHATTILTQGEDMGLSLELIVDLVQSNAPIDAQLVAQIERNREVEAGRWADNIGSPIDSFYRKTVCGDAQLRVSLCANIAETLRPLKLV